MTYSRQYKYLRGDRQSGGKIRSTRDAIDFYIHARYGDIEDQYRQEIYKLHVLSFSVFCNRFRNHRAFGVADDDAAFERAASKLMPDGESRVWNNAIMELGGVACQQAPRCDEAGCPWHEWCRAHETGDFTAPDVSTQPSFEGSRRQMRGRVVSALKEHDELALDELGPRIRVDYTPDGEHGREWFRDLLADPEDDGLVEVAERDGDAVARLRTQAPLVLC